MSFASVDTLGEGGLKELRFEKSRGDSVLSAMFLSKNTNEVTIANIFIINRNLKYNILITNDYI
jgi:hypothetical protein